MKRAVTAALLLAPLTLAGIAADRAPAEPCTGTEGREALTTDGLELSFDAPAITAPELSATRDVTGPAISPHRGAHFFFHADLAPYDEAQVTIDLSWANPSDYDIFVVDADGYELARSAEVNAQTQTWSESASLRVSDCEGFTLRIASWAGTPAETLDLAITVSPDVATEDTTESPRPAGGTILYLAGDRPGQLGTLHTQGGAEDVPFRTSLSPDRPTTGQPNQHTRPAVGFDAHRNPFQPWWHVELPVGEEIDIVGDASALVWLSSQTSQEQPATYVVRLYVDGGAVGEVAIPGDQVHPEPRPFLVAFPGIDVRQAFSVTLQVSTPPVVSSSDPEPHDEPGDANHTVWYDSVQYQSRILLP